MEVDLTHGAVLVLGVMYGSNVGTLIGSPLAAGASSLAVAYLEMLIQSGIPAHLSEEWKRNVLCMRWLDDLVIFIRKGASEALKSFVQNLVVEDLYGNGLRLIRVRGSEAFGFHFAATPTGEIEARQKLGFAEKPAEWAAEEQELRHWLKARARGAAEGSIAKPPPHRLRLGMHGGPQWRLGTAGLGIAMGYVLRFLDMSNLEEKNIVGGLVRIFIELKRTGTPVAVLHRVLRRLRGTVWCSTEAVKHSLEWTDERAAGWAHAYDAARLAKDRLVELQSLASEI